MRLLWVRGWKTNTTKVKKGRVPGICFVWSGFQQAVLSTYSLVNIERSWLRCIALFSIQHYRVPEKNDLFWRDLARWSRSLLPTCLTSVLTMISATCSASKQEIILLIVLNNLQTLGMAMSRKPTNCLTSPSDLFTWRIKRYIKLRWLCRLQHVL